LEITLSTIINRENAGIVPAFFYDLSQALSKGEGFTKSETPTSPS
jgi:hypothetical protein